MLVLVLVCVCVCACVFVRLCVYLSVGLSVCLSVCLPACLPASPPICLLLNCTTATREEEMRARAKGMDGIGGLLSSLWLGSLREG